MLEGEETNSGRGQGARTIGDENYSLARGPVLRLSDVGLEPADCVDSPRGFAFV